MATQIVDSRKERAKKLCVNNSEIPEKTLRRIFIYLSFTGNSVVRHGRDGYATTFGKKIYTKITHTNKRVQ